MSFHKFLALISICYDLHSQRLFQDHKRYLLLLICCSRHLGFVLLVYKWHFLMLISSEIHTVPCIKYYYVDVLITLSAVVFSKIMEHDVRTDIGI